ncbi:MAG: WD40/YVTN/BNR-like repeat-containing protein, partial [Gemmatimonadota bacterium]
YTYARLNNFAIGQFYRIGVDDRDPYWIYGGMQDAHSWMGPSATTHWLGILNQDWVQIGFSDGTGQAVDLKGPRFVYSTSSGGSLTRVDVVTGDRWDIQPQAPTGERYRFDWTAPVLASRYRAGTVYLGANKLLISRDFGVTWTATADLTRQVNRDTLRIGGVPNTEIRLSRNDGESSFSEITTVAESPVDSLVLWVGTDDGNIQVSRDGGRTWTEVGRNLRCVADGSFVDRIVASASGKGAAIVAFENHRSGDFRPYLFRTTDFGRSWTSIAAGLPDGNPVRSIAEYPGKPNVLVAGTERFLHVSVDTGATWARLTANLPPTRFDDIVIHPRTKDIVLATHGRSIWVLDDASPLAAWTPAVASAPATLFPVRRATLTLYRADVSTA